MKRKLSILIYIQWRYYMLLKIKWFYLCFSMSDMHIKELRNLKCLLHVLFFYSFHMTGRYKFLEVDNAASNSEHTICFLSFILILSFVFVLTRCKIISCKISFFRWIIKNNKWDQISWNWPRCNYHSPFYLWLIYIWIMVIYFLCFLFNWLIKDFSDFLNTYLLFLRLQYCITL